MQAFDNLIKNSLITDPEKHELIASLTFTPKQMWVKDYYMSKINKEITENLQGMVELHVEDNLKM